VVLVGQRRLRDWVALMLLADLHDGSDEQLNIAMTRARMAELMAEMIDRSLAEEAFTAGLVSALDLLLGTPLPNVLSALSLTTELEEAVLARQGVLGGIVGDVVAWEVGGYGSLRSGLGIVSVSEAYLEALAWSTEVCGALEKSR
jgi:EAL and modified HD-GYP domain-containing signal transduction protein